MKTNVCCRVGGVNLACLWLEVFWDSQESRSSSACRNCMGLPVLRKISAGNYFPYFTPPAKSRGAVITVHLPGWCSWLNSAELQAPFEDFYWLFLCYLSASPVLRRGLYLDQSCVALFPWYSSTTSHSGGNLSPQQGVDVLPLNKAKWIVK